jgi:hypothetical protein
MNTQYTKMMAVTLLAMVCLCRSEVYGGVKTSAAQFLKVPVSAEAMGLGGGAVVSGSGLGVAMENPAALGFMKQGEFQSSYGSHLEGYKLFNAGYGYNGGAFNGGLSVTRVAADSFEGRDAQGASTGGFGASDMAVNLSVAKKFEGFAGGVTVKYITSVIERESASALAMDVGAVFLGGRHASYPYKVGIAVRNIGSPMKYISKSEPLPLTAAAGVGVDVGGGLETVLNVSGNVPEGRMEFGVGMGLSIGGGFALNGGLAREMGSAAGGSAGMPFGVNAGIGFKVSNFVMNYGFIPLGEMGNMQRMSMTFKFGGESGARKVRGGVKRSADEGFLF